MKYLNPSFLLFLFVTTLTTAQNKYYVSSPYLGSCEGTIDHPYSQLQDALGVAIAGDTIFVAEGTYFPDEGDCGMINSDFRTVSFVIPGGVVLMGGYNLTFT